MNNKNDCFVHPSSYVDEGATVGKGTKIWHFSHIQKGAVIGENCSLGQNVNIANNVKVGNGVRIQNNVSVYEGVELEDNVFCGPSCVFTNVVTPRAHFPVHGVYAKTLIKEGASLGANSTVVCGHTVGRSALIAAGAVVTKVFELATVNTDYFIPARVLVGLGAICFTLFSIVSILESGTSGKG